MVARGKEDADNNKKLAPCGEQVSEIFSRRKFYQVFDLLCAESGLATRKRAGRRDPGDESRSGVERRVASRNAALFHRKPLESHRFTEPSLYVPRANTMNYCRPFFASDLESYPIAEESRPGISPLQ